MSSKHIMQVWHGSKARGLQKLVLLALADHADRHGEVELPLRDIAALCGMAKSSVENTIAALITAGELRVLSQGAGRGKPMRYWLTPPERARTSPADDAADTEWTIDHAPSPHRVTEAQESQAKEPVADPALLGAEATGGAVRVGLPADGSRAATSERMDATAGRDRQPITQRDVTSLLDAAGIAAPAGQPLFWHRREHRADLAGMVERFGGDINDLCAAVRRSVEAGRKLPRDPQRLTEIMALVEGGGVL